jgi:hypothetical protein
VSAISTAGSACAVSTGLSLGSSAVPKVEQEIERAQRKRQQEITERHLDVFNIISTQLNSEKTNPDYGNFIVNFVDG